jgi:hypothetical protein
MSKNLANAAPSSPARDHLTPFNSSRGSPRDAWRLSLRRCYPLFWGPFRNDRVSCGAYIMSADRPYAHVHIVGRP